MNQSFDYAGETLRGAADSPVSRLQKAFPEQCGKPESLDAMCLDSRRERVVGWAGLPLARPIIRAALNLPEVHDFVRETLGGRFSGLFVDAECGPRFYRSAAGRTEEMPVPPDVEERLAQLRRESDQWIGALTPEGDHVFDPQAPSPGTHFRVNLLLGDRVGFANPLLTTPKALVDEWGRGSSRSHADKQILATRWDLVPEENGFPANRQLYLLEGGRQIFYSAAPGKGVRIRTRHAANHTVITYEMADGLKVERTFFVVPAEEGLPLGVEAQLVTIMNEGARKRDLDIVFTGMFGYEHPGALTVDVIYTCVTVEPRALHDRGGRGPMIVAPKYTPAWGLDNQPFNLTVGFGSSGEVILPDSYCLDFRRFVGNGSLEEPENIAFLDNAYPRKGPAFFALKLPVSIEPGTSAECQSFNGLVSRHEGEPVTEEVMARRMTAFASKALDREWGHGALRQVLRFQDEYRRAVQVKTPRPEVDRLVNAHLPFQIRYQTYVSRSFCLTQKGFRQIGFREIQDLFAAMPFEIGAGRQEHVKDLIGIWAGHIYRFGYANHQFYWNGVEPGRYSDDALWLFQAVARYIDLTGDRSILRAEWPVAGESGTRRLFDTFQAVLRYSGKISIGRNGLPLIDHADWNDTLNLDGEGIHGPQKEELYRKQVADGEIKEGDPLKSDLSESVMNGFLLEVARTHMVRFARMIGEGAAGTEWADFGPVLAERLQKAWKGDFFARCYINRPNDAGITYMGAAGDGLSADSRFPGSYFLNSFSWSVLSGIATDEQIRIMLERLETVLLTPFGLRLSSPARFRLIMPHAGSGDYAYGDRENGAVFKHASLMAACALVEASRKVKDAALAERLGGLAWRILQVTAPFVTLEDPYRLAGNPRFCSQYTNPATHEHVGPLLSGTAPWMWLTYLAMLGIRFRDGAVELDPVLPAEWTGAEVDLRVPAGRYHIEIRKPPRFVRRLESPTEILINGKKGTSELPPSQGGEPARVHVRFG